MISKTFRDPPQIGSRPTSLGNADIHHPTQFSLSYQLRVWISKCRYAHNSFTRCTIWGFKGRWSTKHVHKSPRHCIRIFPSNRRLKGKYERLHEWMRTVTNHAAPLRWQLLLQQCPCGNISVLVATTEHNIRIFNWDNRTLSLDYGQYHFCNVWGRADWLQR
jgi:hypothetical protein